MSAEVMQAILEMEADDTEKTLVEVLKKAKVSEKGVDAIKHSARILEAFKDELPEGLHEQLTKTLSLAKAENPFAKPDEEDEDEMKKALAAKSELVKKLTELHKTKGGDAEALAKEIAKLLGVDAKPAPVAKAEVSPEIQALLKSRDDELAAIKKQLDTERDERALAGWIEKARTDLEFYPGQSAEELGGMLKSLEDHDADLAKAQFESMKKSSDLLKNSAMLSESHGGVVKSLGNGSAHDKIQKLADNLIQKSDVTYTKEQAFTKALEMNPELYAEYMTEHPAQTE